MDTGRNTREVVDAAHVEALVLLIATLRRHRAFFATKSADYHARLMLLVHRCRGYLRSGATASARDMVATELFYLFGVRVNVPATRYLLLIAAILRLIVVDSAAAGQQLVTRGGVNALIKFLNQALASSASAAGKIIVIDVLVIDSLLVQLAQHDPEAVAVLELHYFAGLSVRDISLEVGADIDVATTMARGKAWLVTKLQDTVGGCNA